MLDKTTSEEFDKLFGMGGWWKSREYFETQNPSFITVIEELNKDLKKWIATQKAKWIEEVLKEVIGDDENKRTAELSSNPTIAFGTNYRNQLRAEQRIKLNKLTKKEA